MKDVCGELGETLKKIFLRKIVRVLKCLFQNLTRCKSFVKEPASQNFFLRQNCAF